MNDTESLRQTLQMLRDEGVLDRVQSIHAGGVTFFPPPPPPVSEALLGQLQERRQDSLDAFERRMRTGAAGGIQRVERKVGA